MAAVTQVKSGPNHRWQDAMPIALGKTVFASGDDAEYIPLPNTPEGDRSESERHRLVPIRIRRR